MTNKSQITKKRIYTLSFFYIHFLCVCSALAIGAGGQGEHTFTWKDWFWPVVNFAILVFILVFFGRKPVREYFKKRTELIEKSLQDAKEAKEIAQKTLEEVKAKLSNTDKEIEKILEAARSSGEKEKEAIVAEGQRLKERIIEQAKANIDFELQKAKEKIKSEAALMALDLAEKQIKDKLGKKEQEDLINEYIKKLEARN